jgi:hypothetical protein
VTENQVGYIPLPGVKKSLIKKIRLLPTGSELTVVNNHNTAKEDIAFVTFGESPLLPDPVDTVIEVGLI